jgi:uncharacterized protein (TIGR03663 family)
MSSRETKLHKKRKTSAGNGPHQSSAPDEPVTAHWPAIAAWLRADTPFGLTRWQVLVFLAVIVFVAFTRFWDLGTRALHHDESMHARFSWDIYRSFSYRYNPVLHGPFQFYLTAFMYFLFGVSDAVARFGPALFGVISVLLVYPLKPYLGRTGMVLAAVLMAISPPILYFSRFARNDIYVVAWTLLIVLALFGWLHTRQRWYIYLGATAVALSLATKENTYITLAIVGVFIVLRFLQEQFTPGLANRLPSHESVKSALADLWRERSLLFSGIVLFLLIFVTFFTAFYTHPQDFASGVVKALEYWLAQHDVSRGNQPIWYYFMQIPLYELVVAVFAVPALWSLTRRGSLTDRFICFWFVGAVALYSAAGERMPWLVLHLSLPGILLVARYLGQKFSEPNGVRSHRLAFTLFLLIGVYALHTGMPLSFSHGDTPRDLLVYVQTTPDVPYVVAQIEQVSRKLTTETEIVGIIDNENSWPFAWYLRDYSMVGYIPTIGDPGEAAFVIVTASQVDSAREHLSNYVPFRYKLRWWFPEELYRELKPTFVLEFITNSTTRSNFTAWLVSRKMPKPIGSQDFYFFVRGDLVQLL